MKTGRRHVSVADAGSTHVISAALRRTAIALGLAAVRPRLLEDDDG